MRAPLIAALATVALLGCASPDPDARQTGLVATPMAETQRWWRKFNDPLMDSLVEQLLAENIDIRIARTRVDEARAITQQTRSRLFPELSVNAASTRGNSQPGTATVTTISRGGFDANWEADVFGANRARNRAADARTRNAYENVEVVRNSVLAELIRAVIDWRQALQTVQITQTLLAAQDEQIHLLSVRADAGLITQAAVARARAEREQTAVQMPLAQAAAQGAQYRIERLLGRPAETLAEQLRATAPLPLALPAVEPLLTISLDTMRRRPDIRAAEFELIAARADLATARADVWPRLSLSGFFGVQDTSGRLLVADNPLWSVGANVALPLFNFGRLRAAIAAADSRSQRAVAEYENVVLIALQETHTALTDYVNGMNAVAQQQAALRNRQDTVQLSQERFQRGLNDMTDLTTAQAELNLASLRLIERQTEAATAFIRLNKALATAVANPDAVTEDVVGR